MKNWRMKHCSCAITAQVSSPSPSNVKCDFTKLKEIRIQICQSFINTEMFSERATYPFDRVFPCSCVTKIELLANHPTKSKQACPKLHCCFMVNQFQKHVGVGAENEKKRFLIMGFKSRLSFTLKLHLLKISSAKSNLKLKDKKLRIIFWKIICIPQRNSGALLFRKQVSCANLQRLSPTPSLRLRDMERCNWREFVHIHIVQCLALTIQNV